ncbi:MAG: hypothetical protein ACPLY9_06600 [Nitrososphaerales archaeon]
MEFSAHPGELAFQGDLLVWINEIIKAENLPFDGASQEFIMKGQERPDILLWKNKRVWWGRRLKAKCPIERQGS